MIRQFGFLLLLVVLSACDSPEKRITDAGADSNNQDLVDVPDLTDVSDMKDVSDAQDGPDGETWPAPSCAEDPTQVLVATTYYDRLVANYPYLYIPMYDSQANRTTMYSYHVETNDLTELFVLEDYLVGFMVMDVESSSIWFSANGPWDWNNPANRLPPQMFVWHIVSETLEEMTGQLPPLRSDGCQSGYGTLYLQTLDFSRNRMLLYCSYPSDSKVFGDLYFMDLTSGEKTFLGHHDDMYFAQGNPLPELLNTKYFNVRCAEWTENSYNGNWNGCYWKVDQVISSLIYQSSEGDRINGSTGLVSSDSLVYQTWQTENGIELTATNLQTMETEIVESPPVFPQSISPAGKLFPRLMSWTEGYDVQANGNWLQAGSIGHVFLWDRDTQIYRQVTCLEGNGRYTGVYLVPGDPTGRYGLILSKIGDTHLIHLKDLRAAGIMSEDGQLLPKLARK